MRILLNKLPAGVNCPSKLFLLLHLLLLIIIHLLLLLSRGLHPLSLHHVTGRRCRGRSLKFSPSLTICPPLGYIRLQLLSPRHGCSSRAGHLQMLPSHPGEQRTELPLIFRVRRMLVGGLEFASWKIAMLNVKNLGPDGHLLNHFTLDFVQFPGSLWRSAELAVPQRQLVLRRFAILDRDPFEVAPKHIKDVPVWGTALSGRVFEASR